MYIIGYPLLALVQILNGLLFLYTIVIIAQAILSWVNPDPYHPVVRILHRLTDPAYSRLRRYLPQTGTIDLTPLVLILAIMFIQQGILPVFARIAQQLIG